MRIKDDMVAAGTTAGDEEPTSPFTQASEFTQYGSYSPIDFDDDYSFQQSLATSLGSPTDFYLDYWSSRSYDKEAFGIRLGSEHDPMDYHQLCCDEQHSHRDFDYNVEVKPDSPESSMSNDHSPQAATSSPYTLGCGIESDKALSQSPESFSDWAPINQYTPPISRDSEFDKALSQIPESFSDWAPIDQYTPPISRDIESDKSRSQSPEYFSDWTQYTPPVSPEIKSDKSLSQSPEYFSDWTQYTPPVSPDMSSSGEHHASEPRTPLIPPKVLKQKPSSNRKRGRPRRHPQPAAASSPAPETASPRLPERTPLDILNDMNHLWLLRLRETQRLSWKQCAEAMKKRAGQYIKIPTLQMRRKRFKDRVRIWASQNKLGGVIDKSNTVWMAEAMINSYLEHHIDKNSTSQDQRASASCHGP